MQYLITAAHAATQANLVTPGEMELGGVAIVAGAAFYLLSKARRRRRDAREGREAMQRIQAAQAYLPQPHGQYGPQGYGPTGERY